MLAPSLFRALVSPVLRLPPGNRLRTALLRAMLERAYSAVGRGDIELVSRVFYLPDAVLNFAEDPGPNYERRYVGRDASFGAYRSWIADWGAMERVPAGFVDRGETLVVLGRERIRGEGSGIEIDRELGQVFRLRGAGIAEQTEHRTWDGALAQ